MPSLAVEPRQYLLLFNLFMCRSLTLLMNVAFFPGVDACGDKGRLVVVSVTILGCNLNVTEKAFGETLLHALMLHTGSHSNSLSPLEARMVLQLKTGHW